MPEKVILVPGWECYDKESYPRTRAALEAAGFAMHVVTVPWEGRNFADDVASVTEQVRAMIEPGSIVLGHSFGATLALSALPPRADIGVLIASPGSNCAEGLLDEGGRDFTARCYPGQLPEVEKYSIAALARRATIRPDHVGVLHGEIETPEFSAVNGLTMLAAHNLGVEATSVLGASHSIDRSENYIDAVVTTTRRISSALRAPRP